MSPAVRMYTLTLSTSFWGLLILGFGQEKSGVYCEVDSYLFSKVSLGLLTFAFAMKK
jgi:hypothetical protein